MPIFGIAVNVTNVIPAASAVGVQRPVIPVVVWRIQPAVRGGVFANLVLQFDVVVQARWQISVAPTPTLFPQDIRNELCPFASACNAADGF